MIERDVNENGVDRVVVTGVDIDEVTSCALDEKNALAIESCPEVIGPYRDIGSGCWRATIVARKGTSV